MTKITITLPSLYPDALRRALYNVQDATRTPHEVLVVSPVPPPVTFPSTVWVRERPGMANGCNAGHARAYAAHATGDYIMPWVDDHLLADGWDVVTLRNYERREKAFHATAPGKPFCLGLRHTWPLHVGTEFGIYYPYFPFSRRKYIEQVGWFDPAYKKGFADSDLAFRFWQAGGRCEWSDHALIVVHHDDDRKAGVVFEQADMDLFVARWAPKYGAGWKTGKIRDFNMDIEPDNIPQLVDPSGRTVYQNEPAFRDRALASGWRE